MAPDKLPDRPPRANERPVGWAIVVLAVVIGIVSYWVWGGGFGSGAP